MLFKSNATPCEKIVIFVESLPRTVLGKICQDQQFFNKLCGLGCLLPKKFREMNGKFKTAKHGYFHLPAAFRSLWTDFCSFHNPN